VARRGDARKECPGLLPGSAVVEAQRATELHAAAHSLHPLRRWDVEQEKKNETRGLGKDNLIRQQRKRKL